MTSKNSCPSGCTRLNRIGPICVNQQRGVNSRAYTPGPLSIYKEYNLDRFLRWYLKEMNSAIG